MVPVPCMQPSPPSPARPRQPMPLSTQISILVAGLLTSHPNTMHAYLVVESKTATTLNC